MAHMVLEKRTNMACTAVYEAFTLADNALAHLDNMRETIGSIAVAGASIRVLSKEIDEILFSRETEQEVTVLDILVRPGEACDIRPNSNQQACAFLISGRATINGAEAQKNELHVCAEGEPLRISTKGLLPCRVVYCASEPENREIR
ncbi:hypothetical protein LJC07_03030 [Christensenellaceae bacterium OttesenSCG-928-L17]|nr:hypothetical protein [Christensenellaceae bacterium OttesenSCG-928-L17]